MLRPQHTTSPLFLTAHPCASPTARSAASLRPDTATGSIRYSKSPEPSSPSVLLPQHAAVPSFRSAHVVMELPATFTTSVRPLRRFTARGFASFFFGGAAPFFLSFSSAR